MRTSFNVLAAALTAAVASAGCGGRTCGAGTVEENGVCAVAQAGKATGTYEERCQYLCVSPDTLPSCTQQERDGCLTECRVRTNALSVGCASCLFDHSSPLTSPDPGYTDCHRMRMPMVSDPVCVDFCKNG